MSILSHSEILNRIHQGDLKIEPFDETSIGPASIDLRVSDEFRVFSQSKEIYHLDNQANFQDITKVITVRDYFTLMPGQTAHGITIEKLTLPEDLCAFIEGRSSIGRLGLTVHITASFIQPGVSNHTVLELHNEGPIPLALHPGTKICQIILMDMLGKAKYEGKFKDQRSP